MDIRINKLTLHNFKGVRKATYDFAGTNARFEGENGVGKTTIFDAFTWLLFGKDHNGLDWTNFDLKPIDKKTKQVIHNQEHSVEAEMTIDGAKRTLRRMVEENWVKPKGESTKILRGHTQSFFIDGIDTGTKSAYDKAIAEWIGEEAFKLLTNPLHFIDDKYTTWKIRREAIVDLVKDCKDDSLKDRFADLIAEMSGLEMELFKKKVAADKSANKKRLLETQANIAAYNRALPDEVDSAIIADAIKKLEAQRDEKIADVNSKISAIDVQIADRAEARKAINSQIDELWKQIYQLRDSQKEYLDSGIADAKKNIDALKDRLSTLKDSIIDLQRQHSGRTMAADACKFDIDNLNANLVRLHDNGLELQNKYNEMLKVVFSVEIETTCPTCGQALPADDIERRRNEAKNAFEADKKKKINALYNDAIAISEKRKLVAEEKNARLAEMEKLTSEVDSLNERMTILKEECSSIENSIAEAQQKLPLIEEELKQAPNFVSLGAQERQLSARILELQEESTDNSTLPSQKRILEEAIQQINNEHMMRVESFQKQLGVAGERTRILAMIAEEEEKEKTFADEVARLERLEFRAAEYVKAEIDSLESAINNLFQAARWKMFDRTIDGGIIEMCEVTSPDGVPYRSMNDAMKILCGMDVIRVFSQKYDCTAPIFIDNAESITKTDFGTSAQVIRLVVSKGKELTMIAE